MLNKFWLILLLSGTLVAHAAREAKTRVDEGRPADVEAQRLFDKAQELLHGGEVDRGVKMLETVVEQYPTTHVRYAAYLALGKYYLGIHEQPKAISVLTNLRTLETGEGELSAADRDLLLEGLYLTGVAHFQGRRYSEAFPILRKITTDYPNSIWANQAYYYIGMCHFAQQSWSKAIEALSMVGTFVDPDSPTAQYVEAGRRLYVKVRDGDLAVLTSLGKPTTVTAETARGDKEALDCIPLGARGDIVIGSLPTEIGAPKPGDRILQVTGGDLITVRYLDANDEAGKANVPRESKVKVVSTGVVGFSLGDLQTPATVAFLDQPLFLLVQDADLDSSDAADSATVTIIARYKSVEDNVETKGVDLQKLLQTEEEKYVLRDQVTLKLAETGAHTGRFGGKLLLTAVQDDQSVNKADDKLTCALDDEIIVTYEDKLHIGGETPRQVTATVRVSGEIDNRPRVSQDVVADPVIRAKKNLVEATAFLELARIFKSMGLLKGVKEKATEGLERVDAIVRSTGAVPSALRQDAFKLKWELHLVADDFAAALATCNAFNRLFPDSPFADQALLGIAKIRMENKDYAAALAVFRQVLALPKSTAKAEAQFRIAEATERGGKSGADAAIAEYKLCAERYPESAFAGASLAKLVDYHIEKKDYAQANAMLEQIFQDYPDAVFLDSMLLKWTLVAYNSGDIPKAREKCSRLLFEYPESSFAATARKILPQIEARLKK